MMDAATLQLLRALVARLKAKDQSAQLAAIESIGLDRLFDLRTLICALGIGGVELTAFIADLATDHTAEPERYRQVLDACRTSSRRPDGTELALNIIRAFGIEEDADAFLRSLQHELAQVTGAPDDLINVALAEMKLGNWAAALEGFSRVLAEPGQKAPRAIYARAATCLHKLGRYAEAEEMNQRGLGEQRDMIALKSTPPSEAVLVRGWGQSSGAPLVSVLCITYNHERYIEGAIRSFLVQKTTFPIEILIHDDASTDGTAAVIRNWQARYPSIIRSVLQTENQFSRGACPIAALLPLTRGKYVATCEGDDYWLDASKLQRQVSFLEAHSDFSCSAHNYYLYNESQLSIRPWFQSRTDRVLTARQLMSLKRLLWLPTLVFRKTFSNLPAERSLSPIGDQFLTSYLGTFGQCAYFETLLGAVRRENQYSIWTPLSDGQKEAIRVKCWLALVRLHTRLGHVEVVEDLWQKIKSSPLDESEKSSLCQQFQQSPVLEPVAIS
jgi:phosphoglycolate phosphatase-like HAD superfamily hydrolase